MRLLLLALMILSFAGCKPPANREESRKQAEKARKVTSDTVKTLSGYDQIQAGERTKARIRQASAQHENDLKEVTPEDGE